MPFEQDHDVMRATAVRPIRGPASTDMLAAIGGLNLPGGQSHPELLEPAPPAKHAHEPIPGERDRSTLTAREAGAVSGQFSGGDIPAGAPQWLDETTAAEHVREGGGVAPVRKKQ